MHEHLRFVSPVPVCTEGFPAIDHTGHHIICEAWKRETYPQLLV